MPLSLGVARHNLALTPRLGNRVHMQESSNPCKVAWKDEIYDECLLEKCTHCVFERILREAVRTTLCDCRLLDAEMRSRSLSTASASPLFEIVILNVG